MIKFWVFVLLIFFNPVARCTVIVDGNTTNTILPESGDFLLQTGEVDLELQVYGTGAVSAGSDVLLAAVADAISRLLENVDAYNLRLGNQSLVELPQPSTRRSRHLLSAPALGSARTVGHSLLSGPRRRQAHELLALHQQSQAGTWHSPSEPPEQRRDRAGFTDGSTQRGQGDAGPAFLVHSYRSLLQQSPSPTPAPAEQAVQEAPPVSAPAAVARVQNLVGTPALYLTYRLNFTSNAQQKDALNSLNSVLANLQLASFIQSQERINITFIELVSWLYVPYPDPPSVALVDLAPNVQTTPVSSRSVSRPAEIAIAATVPVTAIFLAGLLVFFLIYRRVLRQRQTNADLENGLESRNSGSSTDSARGSARDSVASLQGGVLPKTKAWLLCAHWGSKEVQGTAAADPKAVVTGPDKPGNALVAQQAQQAQRQQQPADGAVVGDSQQADGQLRGTVDVGDVLRRMDRPDTATEELLMMPWSDWEIAPEELAICRRPDGSEWDLGSGVSGCVYKATRNGVQVVAIKIFQNVVVKSPEHLMRQREAIKKEVSILKSCHDRNIVQFIGACMQEGKTILVTEYLEGGDLHNALMKDHVGKISWHRSESGPRKSAPPLARRIALDVARGLHFLHSHRIVHFDLKSANILLGRDYTAKIADVGLAKILHDEFLSTLNNDVGTFAWAAPEVLLGNPCNSAVDIYSFGVVLWELCTGEEPVRRHLRAVRVPEECPAEVEAIMLRCRRENPSERPSAKELVDFFSELLQAA